MAIKICLFGPFELYLGDQLVSEEAWPSENTRSLLKIFAGERGRLFLQEELIEHLWPEIDPQKAATNLRGRITELRKILEPSLVRGSRSQFIQTRHGGYCFSKTIESWIDIEIVSDFESQARQCEKEEKLREAIQFYESALKLCRGEYLPEDRYAEWAIELRDRWRERRVELLVRLAECLKKSKSYREAIERFREALKLLPTQEGLYQEWMRCAYQLNDGFQLREAYRECEKVLQRELGINPSTQTAQLYSELQKRDSTPVAKLFETETPMSKATFAQQLKMLPFVGREAELNETVRRIHLAREGQGQFVVISGEMGLGKTRLAEEAVLWAKANLSASVLKGHCYELETPLAFQALLEAFRNSIASFDRVDFANVHRAWLSELAELIPELESIFPDLSKQIALPVEYKQHRFFEIFSQSLSARARRVAPLILCLEDLQWADPSTLDFLQFLLPRLGTIPLVILATYRNEDLSAGHRLHRLLQQGHRLNQLGEIRLRPFSVSEIDSLFRVLSLELTNAHQRAQVLLQQTGGNPFFIAAQLQAITEDGSTFDAAAPSNETRSLGYTLVGNAQAVARHRLESLGAPRRRVLELIAACNEKCDTPLLENLWNGTREELHDHLTALTDAAFLSADTTGYRYRHQAYRDLVYQTLMNEQRRQWLHRQILGCLRSAESFLSAQSQNQLAYHSEQAGYLIEALAHTNRALAHCRLRYENAEALKLIERGHRLLRSLEKQDEQRPWLKQALLTEKFKFLCEEIEVGLHVGEKQEVDRLVQELNTLAKWLEEKSMSAHAQRLTAQLYLRSADFQKAQIAAQQALTEFEKLGDGRSQGHCLSVKAEAHFGAGDYELAKQSFQAAFALFEMLSESSLAVEMLNSLGNVWMKLRDTARALESYQRALQMAETIGSERGEGEAMQAMGFVYLQMGDYEKVLHMCDQSQSIAEKLGNFRSKLFSLTSKATAYYFLGFFERAATCSRDALHWSERMGNPVERAQIHRQYGRILREMGRFTESKDEIESALRIFQEHRVLHDEAEGWRALSETNLAEGNPKSAQESLRKALEIANVLKSDLLLLRCQNTAVFVFYALAQYQEACQTVENVLSCADARRVGGDILVKTYFWYSKILRALERPDEAESALRKSVDLLQNIEEKIQSTEARQSFRNIPWRQELLIQAKSILKSD
jgi:predicted ATPase/DNA-binding SARP family transcriptional activator